MQITKAMELVAASKMRKASESIERSKPYFNILHETLEDIAKDNKDFSSVFTREREGKTCHIVIAGDRGLAGGYNNNLFKSLDIKDGDIIFPIGKKVVEHFGEDNVYTDTYAKAGDIKISDCHAIGSLLAKAYEKGEFTHLILSYTSFVNMLTQEPKTENVLPIRVEHTKDGMRNMNYSLIVYEPDAEETFAQIIPYYISGMVYGAVSESVASELSARRNAMESATDNASEMIENLSLEYNRARQASITQELTEIISGANNLSILILITNYKITDYIEMKELCMNNVGKIVQIIGPVLDIRFEDGELPNILNAIEIDNKGQRLVAEVAQHIGDNVVRCISMGSTDGLVRGMDAVDTGEGIKVPVGEETLGRIFNVLGDAVDNMPNPETKEKWCIHREPPTYEEQNPTTEILETGIKVVDLIAPYAKGGKIGLSICEDDKLDLALELLKKAKEKGVNLVLAVDAKIADSFSNDANTQFCKVNEIPDGWEGLDIGPETEKIFAEVIKNSKTILWNGPTGVFEFDNFTHGSRAVGEAIVEATKNGAFSLVGGGDSVACVNKFGLASGVSYVSTGGGALLEAIEGKVLPGIAAIQE